MYEKFIEIIILVLIFTSAKIPSQITLIMRKYLGKQYIKL